MTIHELKQLATTLLEKADELDGTWFILEGDIQHHSHVRLIQNFDKLFQCFTAGIHTYTKQGSQINSIKSIAQISEAWLHHPDPQNPHKPTPIIEILLIHLHQLENESPEFLIFEIKRLGRRIELAKFQTNEPEMTVQNNLMAAFLDGYQQAQKNPNSQIAGIIAEAYIEFTQGNRKAVQKIITALAQFMKSNKTQH